MRAASYLVMRMRAAAASTTAAAGLPNLVTRAAQTMETPAAPAAWGAPSRLFGTATATAGASLLAYSCTSSQPARAESPSSASKSAATAPPEDRYVIPPPTGHLPKSIVVYQYEVCPFCCKVKSFLDFHNLPYRVVEVNPLTKAELKWSQYRKVPVVVLDDKEQINDSSLIISRLAAEFLDGSGSGRKNSQKTAGSSWFGKRKSSAAAGTASPSEGVSAEEEEKWRRWVDARLVRVITVNIYRSASESLQTFDYISEHGNFGWVNRQAARVVGATMMWGLSGKLRKKYDVQGDVREALYGCANEWVTAVGDRPYLGGSAPNLADLAVFGVMRAVVGTDTFMDLQHKTEIGGWYERMIKAVGESSRLGEA